MGLATVWRRWFGKQSSAVPVIRTRRQHGLSRQQMSPNAVKVMARLKHAGFAGYLVGGGVRDLLLGRAPKDFDVVSDGTPEQLRALFSNSRIIGRRFRLLHVFFQKEIIEVSTFRAAVAEGGDNVYGTLAEDVWRRDFTVNALYYNIADFSVVDYVGGLADLRKRRIRMIGDPETRYREDPVRTLRAIRLSAKLQFSIAPKTESPLQACMPLLKDVPQARLFDEMLKLFFEGNAARAYAALMRYRYMPIFFAAFDHVLSVCGIDTMPALIEAAMQATDQRFKAGHSLNPGFLLSVLVWPAVCHALTQVSDDTVSVPQARFRAIETALQQQQDCLRIPRRFTVMMQAIWNLQPILIDRQPRRIIRCLHHRYFRAAYDFLALRTASGESYEAQVSWWTELQAADEQAQADMIAALPKPTYGRRRRRRR